MQRCHLSPMWRSGPGLRFAARLWEGMVTYPKLVSKKPTKGVLLDGRSLIWVGSPEMLSGLLGWTVVQARDWWRKNAQAMTVYEAKGKP